MKILEKIKNWLSSPALKFCVGFDNLDDFMDYVINNPQFYNHCLYFYKGNKQTLMSIISQDGEKYVPDMSLEFMEECRVKNNTLCFEDALFFSDTISEVVGKYCELEIDSPHKWVYESYNTGTHFLNKAVIGHNNIYLCTE